MSKVKKVIFPALSLTAIFISIFSYWSVGKFQFPVQEQKEQRVLGTEKVVDKVIDYDEFVKTYESENQKLRENTLKYSPFGKKIAYFKNKFAIDYEDKRDENYTSVIVESDGTKETVFQGDDRLSSLDWLSEGEIVVYQSCGTECMQADIVDIQTKIPRDMSIGVGYLWSPDKNYVLAYHYSWRYGISVAGKGDKFGRIIFQLNRNQPPNGSGLTNKTQAVWSPDSSRFAVILRKEKEEKLELLAFSIEGNFKPLFQKDLIDNDFSEFYWKDGKTISYFINGTTIEERI